MYIPACVCVCAFVHNKYYYADIKNWELLILTILVVKEQQQYLKRLEELMSDEDTIDLRYLKTFLAGPPGVGKTTTLNRLLKLFINILSACDEEKPQSTLLANCIHVFALVSSDGTEWISSSNHNHETKLLFRYLCGCKLEDVKYKQIDWTKSHTITNPLPKHYQPRQNEPLQEERTKSLRSDTIPKTTTKQVTKQHTTYTRSTQQHRIHSFIFRLQKLIKSDDHTVLQLLGSTLLNINDIGGQPGFLEMLPALSSGPAMYLVFFDLSKDLDKPYKIPFSRDNTIITPYDAIHTVESTISQILSAISSVHCISPDSSQLNIAKAVEFGEKFQRFQQVQPVAALIGTHRDHLKENPEQKLDSIDKSLKKITKRFSKIIAHPNSNRSFFAVDNLTGTDELDVGPIRNFLSSIFQSHFKDASLPIRSKWLWLSLILRREYRIVSMVNCLKIAESLEMDKEEVDFALWYLHFCTGTLMYYPDIPDEWFKNHIICSPQVVFDSISQLISCLITHISFCWSHSLNMREKK